MGNTDRLYEWARKTCTYVSQGPLSNHSAYIDDLFSAASDPYPLPLFGLVMRMLLLIYLSAILFTLDGSQTLLQLVHYPFKCTAWIYDAER
jgi:hypothetical protein